MTVLRILPQNDSWAMGLMFFDRIWQRVSKSLRFQLKGVEGRRKSKEGRQFDSVEG